MNSHAFAVSNPGIFTVTARIGRFTVVSVAPSTVIDAYTTIVKNHIHLGGDGGTTLPAEAGGSFPCW